MYLLITISKTERIQSNKIKIFVILQCTVDNVLQQKSSLQERKKSLSEGKEGLHPVGWPHKGET